MKNRKQMIKQKSQKKKKKKGNHLYYCTYLLVTAIRIVEVLFSQQMISSILQEQKKNE